MSKDAYTAFLDGKTQLAGSFGFEPLFMPDILFDFQKHLVDWKVRQGRAACFADCGMGKSFMQITWAENVVRKTNKRVLIATPLAVGRQTISEAAKLGVEATRVTGGKLPSDKIVVTNYEQLHHYDPKDFVGMVCDESSILKNFDGATRGAVIEFMRKLPYRLLCTATAAPNDYIELGNSSEALGHLGFVDMISRFFKKAKGTTSRKDEISGGMWRFRGHAERDFWRWVCSWARAVRKPSDLGFSDEGFELPELITRQHVVTARTRNAEFLFDMPAAGLAEQRSERRRSLVERCETAARIAQDAGTAVISWCHLNDEGDLLARLVPGSVQVSGADPDERKEELFEAFERGQARVLVTKPTIAGFGLNWQHCHRQTYFPEHSFEQWYQAIRRCWRFGQEHAVEVDVIASEGEASVLANLRRKSAAAERMFSRLVALMGAELKIEHEDKCLNTPQLPPWL